MRTDLIWNYISLGILAVSGVLVNIIIAYEWGSETLGIFNQLFAFFIIMAQISVMGIHFSTLKHVSTNSHDDIKTSSIIGAAFVNVGVISALVGLVTYFVSGFIGNLFDSPQIAYGLVFVAPAITLFGLNKVTLSAFNGLRHMRLFAFFQAFRYILIILFVSGLAFTELPQNYIAGTFLFSEGLVFIFSFPFMAIQMRGLKLSEIKTWLSTHINFGTKAFLSGVFIEVNSRVDILMLGYFANDKIVGIYSFAAMLAEGYYQLLIVIRNNVNPLLARMHASGDFNSIITLIRETRKLAYPSMFVIGFVAVGLYVPAINFLGLDPSLTDSWQVLIILTSAIWLSSGFSPFEALLTQAGYPAYQSMLNAASVASNIILNAILIPKFGIMGAAIATGLTFILTMVYLNFIVEKLVGISMVTLRVKEFKSTR